jgi:hypothetical protein
VTKYINFFGVGIFTKSDQNQDSQFHLFNFTILQFLAIYLKVENLIRTTIKKLSSRKTVSLQWDGYLHYRSALDEALNTPVFVRFVGSHNSSK